MFSGRWRFRRVVWIAAAALVVIIASVLVVRRHTHTTPEVPQVPFSDLLRDVDSGVVSAVALSGDAITYTRTNGERRQTNAPLSYATVNPSFVPDLARKNIRVDIRAPQPESAFGYQPVLIAIAILGLAGFIVYRTTAGRGVSALGGQTRTADPSAIGVTFADVAGVDEAKDEVKEIVDFLREPSRYSAVGGRIPKGVLLVGPPGTGKTLLARSMAGEANVPFLFASGSDFVEMFAGVGALRVRKLFREARRHGSCIIFIDELDAVGRSRGGNSLSHEEREQTLNQLLVEMDGFAPTEGLVVVAATNRPEILDPALLRPGRFDRQVMVNVPDLRGREQILKLHGRNVTLDPAIDLRQIARGTPGFSGAELANLMNEAALFAVRSGRSAVSTADVNRARDKVLMGAERKSLHMSDHERTTCAYHEAGHAVVAALLPHADPLHKVTIIPRGRALGVTMQLPEGDRYTHTREFLETQIAVLMGGRVAEELFLSQMTSGASNDIERATDIARRMVCEFGMSPLGPMAFRSGGDSWDDRRRAGISEATAQRVDEQVSDLVMRGYDTARRLIEDRRDAVDRMAKQLLDVESLDAEDIAGIISRQSSVVSRQSEAVN